MRKILPLILLPSLLAGCSVTQQLSLKSADGANVATSFVKADTFFADVAADFDSFSDSDEPELSLDKLMEELAESFSYGKGVGDLELIKTGEKSYMLFFTFQEIEKLMESLGSSQRQDILTLQGNALHIRLSLGNYHELERIVPLLASDDFKPFGPRFNQGISEDEYLEMLAFMLGDDAPDAVRSSTISLQIETPQPITSTQGMQKDGPQRATLSFPLIDLLLLQKPIEASVSW